MHDRQIIDNIALVHEAIHSSMTIKDKGMVVKLDMENAFDCTKHSFLFKVLNRFGFCSTFIQWIASCIILLWIGPLING
jgi:hypothetical protein